MIPLPTPTLEIGSALCRWWHLAILTGLGLTTIGCGPSGPERHRISGTVTYQGNPVPHGTIMFEPDSAKGNSGAAGSAMIIEGRFDSAEGGTGFTGGPQIVSIQGFSGVDVNAEYAPYGAPIGGGTSYIKSFDFPEQGDVQHDFEMADVLDADR
ncbi:MAG: hypothetical protein ACF788_08255 [Novipirellula sp. JB048]